MPVPEIYGGRHGQIYLVERLTGVKGRHRVSPLLSCRSGWSTPVDAVPGGGASLPVLQPAPVTQIDQRD